MSSVKIDIYNHVMPPAYVDLVKTHGKEPGMVKRMSQLRMLWDMQARVDMLNGFPGVQQVISLAVPSPEMLGGPASSSSVEVSVSCKGLPNMDVFRRAGSSGAARGSAAPARSTSATIA